MCGKTTRVSFVSSLERAPSRWLANFNFDLRGEMQHPPPPRSFLARNKMGDMRKCEEMGALKRKDGRRRKVGVDAR